jgi:hypothetical protein
MGFGVPSVLARAERVVALCGGRTTVDQGERVRPESDAALLMPVYNPLGAALVLRARDTCSRIQHSHSRRGLVKTPSRGQLQRSGLRIGAVHHAKGVGEKFNPMADMHHPFPPELPGCPQGRAAVEGMAAAGHVPEFHLGQPPIFLPVGPVQNWANEE